MFPMRQAKGKTDPLFREMLAAEKSLYPFDHPENGEIVDAVLLDLLRDNRRNARV